MGNGTYYAVGYGVILNKKLADFEEANYERVESAREKFDIRTSYESNSPYWAIFVHDSCYGEFPQTQRFAKFFEVEVPESTKKKWRSFCKEVGLDLNPELLWIADYD